jgi:small subunit ribosomal protein S13
MAEQQPKQTGRPEVKNSYATLVRIMQTDIPGNKKVLTGLTYLKGISWAISNAMCRILEIDPNKTVEKLDKKEIEKINSFLEHPSEKLPNYLLNRRKDFATGIDMHLVGNSLDMNKEFDIRRLKKIRSYRGLRHATGQPTRGQRTKSHFRTRKKNKAVGVKSKKPEGKK